MAENPLGPSWVELCSETADFSTEDFKKAIFNLLLQPEINSTVILRADVVKDYRYSPEGQLVLETTKETLPSLLEMRTLNLDDVALRRCPVGPDLPPTIREIVRRIIPRNPQKDAVINQTCTVKLDSKSALVTYTPHVDKVEEIPYYLPLVKSVAILVHNNKASVSYIPFEGTSFDQDSRPARIASSLLKTACKHSRGIRDGYQKRVLHDQVVEKTAFQDRYLILKKKYSQKLMESWVENTDPKKHVFEDLAIAAFLIEYWKTRPQKPSQFVDLGCGNGVLVWILRQEGYNGYGVDARHRKTWDALFGDRVLEALREQIVIPELLLQDETQKFTVPMTETGCKRDIHGVRKAGASEVEPLVLSSKQLRDALFVCTASFPKDTFIIGNHSDELTLWIPILGYDFMVIPCCSHALSGERRRFGRGNSAYAALVDHVQKIAQKLGWSTEREMLRIPSTRNCAILGSRKSQAMQVEDLITQEGGADGWIVNSVSLMRSALVNQLTGATETTN